MAERRRRTRDTEQTAHFVVYERRTGLVLAVHHLTALPGVRVPREEVVLRRLRACAADALGRRAAQLAVLRTREAPLVSPSLRVDLAAGKLSGDDRPIPPAEQSQGDTPPSTAARP